MQLIKIKGNGGVLAIDPFSILAVWITDGLLHIQTKNGLKFHFEPPEGEELQELFDDICRDIHWSNEK